jgi:hypothetical protein
MGYVQGACDPAEEFRDLEAFRRAIIKLVEEGLTLPEDYENTETRYSASC